MNKRTRRRRGTKPGKNAGKPSPFCSVKEAAWQLGVSGGLIRRMLANGSLQGIRVEGRVCVARKSVADYTANHSTGRSGGDSDVPEGFSEPARLPARSVQTGEEKFKQTRGQASRQRRSRLSPTGFVHLPPPDELAQDESEDSRRR